MPVDIKKGETEQDFISRCIGEEINAGHEQTQAAAICYSYWKEGKMNEVKNTFQTIKKGINAVRGFSN